jgi:polyphosphate kinase 2 (PPK2 family)
MALQLIRQAYLGTPERTIIVLEGWDAAGRGGVVRRLGRARAREPIVSRAGATG